ncbi:MAG: sel1 repeat family protein [Thermoguttaceae bacterium]|nr:sel1 repeat family protein [Thermoguttaceae bacterium]
MKRFFTAFCALCLTAVFASAEEPELIERPLSWTIDSIQIVWNIEEKQTENYEWRSISDRSNTTSVDNTNLSRDTHATTNTSESHFSADAEASVKGGVGFDGGFFANWGLQGSAGMSAGLGWKQEDLTAKTQQNEWVKSENTTYKATESEDTSKGNQTLRYNRKLLFTVNFVNHTDASLVFTQDSTDTIPVYCGNEHIGNAQPAYTDGEFVIRPTGEPFPCQFEMALNDSSKMKLLESAPEIRITGSQIKISNKEYDDAFTQSIQKFPHFTVRLTADGASREWEFRYNKKSDYTLQEVLETINYDCEAEDLFELGDNGAIISVAGFPVKPSKDSKAFVLLAWNGEPVTALKDLKPRKNRVLDVILVSRAILESRQGDTLVTLIPFKETLETWAKDGLFDGKYLELNLLADEDQRIAEIKKLAEAGDVEMQYELVNYYIRKKDANEVVRWLRKAAEQGYAPAQTSLGLHYLLGTVVEKDYEMAATWFRKAAEQGDLRAQNHLAVCYFRGTGVDKDEKEAVKWYRKAAEQGFIAAQYNLGNCYRNGTGVDKDEKEAVSWYRKAAEQGDVQAQEALRELGY